MKTQLQLLPLVAILALFLIGPIVIIFVVSFWDYTEFSLVPDFVLTNYIELFQSTVTYSIYLNTIKFAALSWFFTLIIGFAIAYFLAFHVRTLKWQVILSHLHYPLLDLQHYTNDSLDPVLGRHGLVNKFLLNLGIIDQPIEWLLYSDFAVVLAFVHLYTLFMVVPIFNSMMRIDKAVLEAARDAGASAMQVLLHTIIPLPAGYRYRHNLRSQLGDGGFRNRPGHVWRTKRFSRRRDEP